MRFARALKEQLQDNVKYIESSRGTVSVSCLLLFFLQGFTFTIQTQSLTGKEVLGFVVGHSKKV